MDDPHDTTGPWLAAWFQHPSRAELPSGHHLRPLRAADDGLSGLPAGIDVAAAAASAAARTGYVYGVFDDEERDVLGVVALSPGRPGRDTATYDVVVRCVVREECGHLAAVLAEHLPSWLARDWPFRTWLVESE